MAAKEVREYRRTVKKLVEVEARSRLLEQLIDRKIGLNEEENFAQSQIGKFRALGDKSK